MRKRESWHVEAQRDSKRQPRMCQFRTLIGGKLFVANILRTICFLPPQSTTIDWITGKEMLPSFGSSRELLWLCIGARFLRVSLLFSLVMPTISLTDRSNANDGYQARLGDFSPWHSSSLQTEMSQWSYSWSSGSEVENKRLSTYVGRPPGTSPSFAAASSQDALPSLAAFRA